ncbi:MAG: hypothetical protein RIM84_18700 [Alphaproteobacteria bacterium]
MLRKLYALIMDENLNPLSRLPKMVRFQYMMILSFMWSTVFTLWIGSAMVLGPTVIGHVAVLIAVFFTADVFRRARAQAGHHRDRMRDGRDGTVLYDDVWGAPTASATLTR